MARDVQNGSLADVLTHWKSKFARLRVDPKRSSFFDGREFKLSREYSVSDTPLVLKLVSPVDFIIELQSISCDSEGVIFKAYRSTQVTESGTFTEAAADVMTPNCDIASVNSYTKQSQVLSGGAISVIAGQVARETIRVKSSGSTAQQTTVSGGSITERGLPAGTYYLQFSRMTASGTATGIFNLIIAEQPFVNSPK